ncbi:MAG: hypothetical protein EXS25_01015 [Pedosphaera sp.]|nr:hypothetical protein [Pedosphaera sp.]
MTSLQFLPFTALLAALVAGIPSTLADSRAKSPPPPKAPPIVTVPANAGPEPARYTYDQRPLTGRAPLISPEQARAVIDRFKAGYPKIGGPRLVLFVNRDLVDESSGLRLMSRRESTDSLKADLQGTSASSSPLGQNVTVVGTVSAGGAAAIAPLKGTQERVTGENTFTTTSRPVPSLTDRQTVRDIERLMGRPLRMGGAKLADQRVASQLLTDRSVQEFLGTTGGPAAAKDREALQKVADVVLEVLISSRTIAVPGISSDQIYTAPDIQVTAIRIDSAQIIGQASSRDILGPDRLAGRLLRSYDVNEITEAVTLGLMEDMMQGIN